MPSVTGNRLTRDLNTSSGSVSRRNRQTLDATYSSVVPGLSASPMGLPVNLTSSITSAAGRIPVACGSSLFQLSRHSSRWSTKAFSSDVSEKPSRMTAMKRFTITRPTNIMKAQVYRGAHSYPQFPSDLLQQPSASLVCRPHWISSHASPVASRHRVAIAAGKLTKLACCVSPASHQATLPNK